MAGLSGRQKKFCLFYLQDFNAEKAATKAGYHSRYGYELLNRSEIQEEIESLREQTMGEVYASGRDVLQMYIRAAFADITDYVEFGTVEQDGKKSCYVHLRDSDKVDGQLIEEVSVTSGGGKIKLLDKGKALEKLERFFDIFGMDAWKRFVEEQKLNVRENGTNSVIEVVTGVNRNGEEDEV